MTGMEREQLDRLVEIAREADSPLTGYEKDFVANLNARRDRMMTPRQGDLFDRLCGAHLTSVRDRSE